VAITAKQLGDHLDHSQFIIDEEDFGHGEEVNQRIRKASSIKLPKRHHARELLELVD